MTSIIFYWYRDLGLGMECLVRFTAFFTLNIPGQKYRHTTNARYWQRAVEFPREIRNQFLTDHDWKNDFFIECLSPILEAMTNTARPPDYTYILGLDKSVRDFAVPSLLEEQNTKATPRFLIMQRGLVVMGREIGLFLLFFLVRLFYI